MAPAPLVVSSLLGLSAVTGLVGFALDPEPFSRQSALLIALGLGWLTLVAVAGILLARGRWSRWMALVVAGLWFAQATIRPLDGPGAITIGSAVAVAAVAAGPRLGSWLRHSRTADAPPPASVILLLLLTGTPALIGFASVGKGPGVTGWALTAWSWAIALGLARAISPALWMGRLVHVPVSVAGGLLLGFPAVTAVLAKAATETLLLWRRDLYLAVNPLVPERTTLVPIPPELMDPTMMEAVGLDDHGRPLENP